MDAGSSSTRRQCRVAVIGAGAAGLVAARELRAEGHEVVVFEQHAEELGGTWIYSEEVESDPMGCDPQRRRVHSSMYQGLTTNLPREIMGFTDLPLSPAAMAGRSIDGRRFPCSEEVLRYLQVFADRFQLQPLVRFSTQVVHAVPLPAAAPPPSTQPNNSNSTQQQQQQQLGQQSCGKGEATTCLPWPRWQITWRQLQPGCNNTSQQQQQYQNCSKAASTPAAEPGPLQSEVFDALLVCNGHYTEPHLPQLPGADKFPGQLMHSHNFRRADAFLGQAVAVIGASFSGLDIARLVAQHASCVYVCAREWSSTADLAPPAVKGCSNVRRRGMITRLTPTGGAEFAVGESVPHLDAVICCTGFNYSFPFLDLKALGLSTAQQHVAPLYQHLFTPTYGAGLAFIGLPWRCVPFPLFELQTKLCARLLSGAASLPPAEDMAAAIKQHLAQRQQQGLRPEHSHCLDYCQLEYHRWLAAACGPDVPVFPNWRAVLLHGILLFRRLQRACERLSKRLRQCQWYSWQLLPAQAQQRPKQQ